MRGAVLMRLRIRFCFQKRHAEPRISQVHPSAPEIAMSLKPMQVHRSAPARPCEGWRVNILPVRSTALVLPEISMEDHAFNSATTAGVCTGDCTPLAGFFAGGSAASLAAALRTR